MSHEIKHEMLLPYGSAVPAKNNEVLAGSWPNFHQSSLKICLAFQLFCRHMAMERWRWVCVHHSAAAL